MLIKSRQGIIIIIIIILLLVSFRSMLSSGVSLESKWQQVCSVLQDFTEYSNRTIQYCTPEDFEPPTNFQFPQSFLKAFWDRSVRTNYSWFNLTSCLTAFTVLRQGSSIIIIVINILLLASFFTPMSTDGLSLESEWQPVFSSLLESSHLCGRFKIAVVWMVSSRPTIFNTSSSLSKLLETVPSAPITITLMFNSVLRFLAWFKSSSSSSSYRAGSTDIRDPLSPLLPIVHRPRFLVLTFIYYWNFR